MLVYQSECRYGSTPGARATVQKESKERLREYLEIRGQERSSDSMPITRNWTNL